MSADELTQEQSLKDFLEYNVANSINELETQTKDDKSNEEKLKEVAKEVQGGIENAKNVVGYGENIFDTANIITNYKVLQNIQLILGDINKPLSLTNYVLELYITDDRMTFYAKIGNDIISGLTFAEILLASQKISNYLINKINLIPKGGHPLIVIIGGVVGFFTAKEAGDATEGFIDNIVDFIAKQSNNIPFILESDLLYSSIVGCPNPPIKGGPCTQVALILPSSRGLKKHNDDYPIMQSLVSSGVFSDKGVNMGFRTR